MLYDSAVCKKGKLRGELVDPLVNRAGSWPYVMSGKTRWKPGVPLAGRTCSCSMGNLHTNIWSTDCGAYTQVPVWLSDSQQAHEYGMGFSQVTKWLQLRHRLRGVLARSVMNRYVLFEYEFCMRLFLYNLACVHFSHLELISTHERRTRMTSSTSEGELNLSELSSALCSNKLSNGKG